MNVSLPNFSPEMDVLEGYLQSVFSNARGLTREAGEYVLEKRGKSLRPRLVLMAARCEAPVSREVLPVDEPVLRMAACVELLHTASLLHDDVVDNAATRRGRPSVNARFGADVSILLADFLFSQAFQMIAPFAGSDALSLLCEATRKMSESELRQIELRGEMPVREDYFRIIEAKTASLFSACAEIGALLANVPPERRRALAEFGRLLGMVFQIADDALDFTADSPEWGKEIGNDLAQGKKTLPLIHTVESASPQDREYLLAQLQNGRKIEHILPYIHKYNGIQHALETAREYARQATALAPLFAPQSAIPHFQNLCDFALERNH